MLYRKSEGAVSCFLCSHRCQNIREGKTGTCGVRQNVGGTLYSLVYGKIVAANIDPIEKKPFYNFHPGSSAYSIASVGCNFRCKNCQNADISQAPKEGRGISGTDMEPQEVVRDAKENGCESVAYTYTEPTVWFEYNYEVSKIARKEGLNNLYVTNGYMTPEMLDTYHPLLDAANVDLKSFKDDFYRDVCGGSLEPVLESLKKMKKQGVWVEITTLVIPGLNDSSEEFAQIASYIKNELGKETPWHISRFHPDYKLLHIPSTNPETIHNARKIGLEAGLRYVYAGNLPKDKGENTYCYKCDTLLIERHVFDVTKNRIKNGKCPVCGSKIDGAL